MNLATYKALATTLEAAAVYLDTQAIERGSLEARIHRRALKIATRLVRRVEDATGHPWEELARGVVDLDPLTSAAVAETREKVAVVQAETGAVWVAGVKRAAPCRDERGRFSACGGGGGKKPPKPRPAAGGGLKPRAPKKPTAKPPAKPGPGPPTHAPTAKPKPKPAQATTARPKPPAPQPKPEAATVPRPPKKPAARPTAPGKPAAPAKPAPVEKPGNGKPPVDLRTYHDSLKHEDLDTQMHAMTAYIAKHQSKTAVTDKFGGMESAERFRHIEFDGLTFRFPDGKPETMMKTVRMLSMKPPIPKELAAHTNHVILSTQVNRDDAHWEKTYGKPGFRSGATGGEGEIVAYHGQGIAPRTLMHEMGHNLAHARYGTFTPPDASAFAKATRSEAPPTSYGAVHPAEDFAESIAGYVYDRERFASACPKRAAVIAAMLENPGHAW